MATTPSTIVVCCDDKIALPLRAVFVIMKQIFQYGVKDIAIKGDKVFVSLSYSPKGETLARKFGNLPVKYIRTKIETEDELNIIEKALKRYRFNIHEEEDALEAIEDGKGKSSKRKLRIKEIPESQTLLLSSDDDDDDSNKENTPPPPPPTSSKKIKREVKPKQPNKKTIEEETDELINSGILTQTLF